MYTSTFIGTYSGTSELLLPRVHLISGIFSQLAFTLHTGVASIFRHPGWNFLSCMAHGHTDDTRLLGLMSGTLCLGVPLHSAQLSCYMQLQHFLLHGAQLSCNTVVSVINFFLQSMKEKADVESIQERNRVLLSNILPSHVIDHFLNPDVDPSVQLI